ncbi:NUDIX domain-containing protein [Micromonospora ureilytica]|uniref:NUDIX domain-containing protein n=1 Tax=Micromonospora ureilytica TaxID=709868 RepID=UPI001F0B7910|nr:NUDIX domain-containing protein [Micromonospora ureilytica]
MHVVVCGALVEHGAVLLVHRSPTRHAYPDLWDLPGGHVEAGESELQALAREMHEELGVHIVAESSSRLGDLHAGSGESAVHVGVWHISEWVGSPTNRAPEEHDDIAWVGISELGGLPLVFAALPALLSSLPEPDRLPRRDEALTPALPVVAPELPTEDSSAGLASVPTGHFPGVTEYAALLHAYGLAVDTPGHLAALADDDPAARARALKHLWSAIIHQGTPWTATPAAALDVAALLADPRVADPGLRAELLNFLAAVAEAGSITGRDLPEPDFDVDAALAQALGDGDEEEIWEDERLQSALYVRAVLGCRQIVPALLATATAAMFDPSPQVQAAAARTIGACGGVAPLD